MVTCKTHISKIILAFTLLSIFFPAVTAIQYISFAQPDTLTQKDLYLYGFNTTSEKMEILGLYNTTSSGIPIPNATDITFIIKPQYSTPLDDPGTFVDSAFAWVVSNMIALIACMFLIGLLLTRR